VIKKANETAGFIWQPEILPVIIPAKVAAKPNVILTDKKLSVLTNVFYRNKKKWNLY